MEYLIIGTAALVIVAVAIFFIKAALVAAREQGRAEAEAKAGKETVGVQKDLGEIQGEVITTKDLEERLRKGTFGGQEP